jgi:threonine dehydrogenase-like Zn-dependent dehydrogenase
MNIFERSEVRAGQTVAIVGAGFLGILLAQLATKARAEVVVISRREHALRLAAATGAAQVRADSHSAAIECALQLTEGRGYNCVIETGGVQATLDIAGAIAAEYGRLIVAGYHQDGLRTVNMQQWNWQALDVVNAHERSLERYAAGMERAIAAILDGRIDPFPLLTHEVTLDTLDDGFAFASTRPDGFMKAWARVAA